MFELPDSYFSHCQNIIRKNMTDWLKGFGFSVTNIVFVHSIIATDVFSSNMSGKVVLKRVFGAELR
jgi:hypothetical protein